MPKKKKEVIPHSNKIEIMIPHAHALHEARRLQRDLRKKLATGAAAHEDGPLYHYTDAAGLMGIVTSGAIWATHYEYLNDASEFKYAAGLMKEVVEKASEESDPGGWRGKFQHVMSTGSGASVYSTSLAGDDDQSFVACFSERGDSLSQWRGYGMSIGGYSLGFPFEHLQGVQERINDSQAGKWTNEENPDISAEFLPCWYDRQEQHALIAEGVERAVHHCETADYVVEDSSLAVLLRAILRSVSSCFKDPAFADEHEWRLVVRVRRPKFGSVLVGEERERTEDDSRMDQIATVHWRTGEYSLIPHIVVPIVLDAALSLPKVIVGPTPLRENAKAAATQLLSPGQEGCLTPTATTAGRRIVCADVKNSTIPFRRV